MKKLRSILLIDDDEATNNLNKYLFSSMNLCDKIDIVGNGKEGMDFINRCTEEEIPELVLLDVNMPLMNGFEFLEEYANIKKTKTNKITLLMLTTSQNSTDVEQSRAYKMLSGYIGKPLLKSKINNIWEIYFS